jgi:hypothetical protein
MPAPAAQSPEVSLALAPVAARLEESNRIANGKIAFAIPE